jgi:hypothetical protein
MYNTIVRQHRHLLSGNVTKYVAFLLVFIFGGSFAAQAKRHPEICSVVGIARGDTLSVRSGPGATKPVIAKLPLETTGIQIVGPVVMNGNDDWVPIHFSSGKGWVRPKFLSSRGPQSLATASSRLVETYGHAPYPTGQSSDFFGAAGPRIHIVPGRSLAYSYASQGYFNRAQVCVAHGDGTAQDIVDGKVAYSRSNQMELTPFGKRLMEGVKVVPRKDITCPECDGTGRGYYTGSCWKCGGSGVIKAPQGWNAILNP